jgi:membrane fusion protein (multidrug efflux system)
MNTITAAPARPRLMIPPPPPVARPRRGLIRLSWVAGVALVVVGLVGAANVLPSRPTADVPAQQSFTGPPGVVALGQVDLENAPGGYISLIPLQQGEVSDVLVHENQAVKKGDVLLRIDDESHALTASQAESGVKIAEAQLAQAQSGAGQYQAAIEGQQAAVDAAKHKIAAAQHRLHRQRQMAEAVNEATKTSTYTNSDELNAVTEELEAGKAALAGEQAKLRAIQATKPETKIREAEGNLTLAKQRAELARLAVKRCNLEAPSDGVVLRLTVTKGSVIGQQTRQAPILFAPDGVRVVRAEVPQEFAHRVQVGMAAVVQDEATGQMSWQGRVKRLGAAYLPKRSAGMEISIGGSDERVLECVVELEPGQALPLLGQRVRVNIGTHGGS